VRRAGQQQVQPGQADHSDLDAAEEQRAGGIGHVVAEHREPVSEACPLPSLPRTPATPMTIAVTRTMSPRMMIMTHFHQGSCPVGSRSGSTGLVRVHP
jgi:hypothetical protein